MRTIALRVWLLLGALPSMLCPKIISECNAPASVLLALSNVARAECQLRVIELGFVKLVCVSVCEQIQIVALLSSRNNGIAFGSSALARNGCTWRRAC